MDIQALAKKLQAFVREHRGLDVPILDCRHTAAVVTEPAIIWTGWSPPSGSFSYSGDVCTDELRFEMPQLSVQFSFGEHDLSGQCDIWTLDVRHATTEEVEALRSIFSPAQHDRFNNHLEPALVIDGVRQRF